MYQLDRHSGPMRGVQRCARRAGGATRACRAPLGTKHDFTHHKTRIVSSPRAGSRTRSGSASGLHRRPAEVTLWRDELNEGVDERRDRQRRPRALGGEGVEPPECRRVEPRQRGEHSLRPAGGERVADVVQADGAGLADGGGGDGGDRGVEVGARLREYLWEVHRRARRLSPDAVHVADEVGVERLERAKSASREDLEEGPLGAAVALVHGRGDARVDAKARLQEAGHVDGGDRQREAGERHLLPGALGDGRPLAGREERDEVRQAHHAGATKVGGRVVALEAEPRPQRRPPGLGGLSSGAAAGTHAAAQAATGGPEGVAGRHVPRELLEEERVAARVELESGGGTHPSVRVHLALAEAGEVAAGGAWLAAERARVTERKEGGTRDDDGGHDRCWPPQLGSCWASSASLSPTLRTKAKPGGSREAGHQG